MKKLILVTLSILLVSSIAFGVDFKWLTVATATPASPTAGDTVTFRAQMKCKGEAARDIQVRPS